MQILIQLLEYYIQLVIMVEGNNRLYSVSTTTGMYTSLGSVNNNNVQITFFSITGPPTAIVENSSENFFFYPNPTIDILNL